MEEIKNRLDEEFDNDPDYPRGGVPISKITSECKDLIAKR